MPSYECPICLEYFNATNNVPTSFPCGHSCCLKHTVEMMLCHVCRAKLPDKLTPNITLRDIAVDYVELMEKLRKFEAASAEPAAVVIGAAPAVLERDVNAIDEGSNVRVASPLVEVSVGSSDIAAAIAPDMVSVLSATLAVSEVTAAQLNDDEDAVDSAPSVGKKSRRKKKKGATMNAAFFRLLPVHLQVLVLEWVAGQHKPMLGFLSRLDVACCNKACRQALLSLMCSVVVPMVSAFDREVCVSATDCYLKWLQFRQVRITYVYITSPIFDWTEDVNKAAFSLPYVTNLALTAGGNHAGVRDVLHVCPNIIILRCAEAECDNEESIWAILRDFPHLSIVRLTIMEKPRSEQEVCDVLEAFGSSLSTLRLGQNCLFKNVKAIKRVLSAVGTHARSLHYFEVSLGGYPFALLVNSLKEIGFVKTLVLFDFVGKETDLINYIFSSPGTLEVHSSSPNNTIDFKLKFLFGINNPTGTGIGRQVILDKCEFLYYKGGGLKMTLALYNTSSISEQIAQQFRQVFTGAIEMTLLLECSSGDVLYQIRDLLFGLNVVLLEVKYCSDCVITEEQMLCIPISQCETLWNLYVFHVGRGEDRFEGLSEASVLELQALLKRPQARYDVERVKMKKT